MSTKISVVVGSYNRLSFLRLTVDSIRRELKGHDHEIIIVDGGSSDGTLAWLCQQKDIVTIVQHNRGSWCGKEIKRRSWGYFMNLAFKAAQGKYICMLSDDCLVVPGAIRNGHEVFETMLARGEKVGALAFYWRNWPEDIEYYVGLTLGGKMFVNHGMYLRTALEEVGFIDEDTYQFYHADGDLCLKIWQSGYSCVESSNSFIEHYSHANMQVRKSNLTTQPQDWERYLNKWENIFYDPQSQYIGEWKYKKFDDPHQTSQRFADAKQNGLKRVTRKLLSGMARAME